MATPAQQDSAPKHNEKPDLRELMSRRIVILDGAYGTALQGFGLEEADYTGEITRHSDVP